MTASQESAIRAPGLRRPKVNQILIDPRLYREIATAYGVSESTVGMIKRGHNWRSTHNHACKGRYNVS